MKKLIARILNHQPVRVELLETLSRTGLYLWIVTLSWLTPTMLF